MLGTTARLEGFRHLGRARDTMLKSSGPVGELIPRSNQSPTRTSPLREQCPRVPPPAACIPV